MGKIMHENKVYSGGGGSVVEANPPDTAGADLTKIKIDGLTYAIPQGDGGGSVDDVQVDNTSVVDQNGIAHINTMTGAGSSSAGAKGLVPAPASGDDEKFLAGDGTWKNATSGGASAVSDLTDVDLDNLANGQILKYNSTTQKWENANESGGGGGASTISDLTDVDLDNLSDGQVLKWNATKQKWENADDFGVSVEECDYALFTAGGSAATGYISLPFTVNADYKVTVDFDIPTYYSNNSVIGNSTATKYTALNGYNNKWYTGNGTSESNFTGSMTGRHTFVNNDGNGNNLFDGAVVTAYSPQTNASSYLLIGGRYSGTNLRGKIYNYKIESISTGNLLCDIKPIRIKAGNIVISEGLYDSVSGELYKCNDLVVGNDE